MFRISNLAVTVMVGATLLAGVGCAHDESRVLGSAKLSDAGPSDMCPAALDFDMRRIDGKEINLAEHYAGKVVLIVNVASRCGFTRQYAGLQELHERYADDGLRILGFPCNQFSNQEPGSAEEILAFCQANFGVEFDMFDKIEVNGENQAPLYAHLTNPATNQHAPGNGLINWNFEKFLIGRSGAVLGHYHSQVEPTGAEMVGAIEAALRAS